MSSNQFPGFSLLVQSEDGSILLDRKVLPDTEFQKQQDTLIVWQEADNVYFSLSFAQQTERDEIWAKIRQQQGKSSDDTAQDLVEESANSTDSVAELPPCEMIRLEDINKIISTCIGSQMQKEKLVVLLIQESYIKKLLNVFRICENERNDDGLYYLFKIFKNIFLLNDFQLFDIIFGDDVIFDVVGCLEYDSSKKRHRHYRETESHRQILQQHSKFREPIEIKNPVLLAKIHKTYRVQYVQDIVLPSLSVFKVAVPSEISRLITINKCETFALIQEDDKLLTDLFAMLIDVNTSLNKLRDLVLFMKFSFEYAQLLETLAKEEFYKSLSSLGCLTALEVLVSVADKTIKSTSIDILTMLVDHSPSLIRGYVISQYNSQGTDQVLIDILIEQIGQADRLVQILKTIGNTSNDRSQKKVFLDLFYDKSGPVLIGELI